MLLVRLIPCDPFSVDIMHFLSESSRTGFCCSNKAVLAGWLFWYN